MAREDFLVNLRNAAYFLDVTAQSDGRPIPVGRLNKALLDIPAWLKPATVAGFDAADFPELSATERHELTQKVGQFLEIAPEAARIVGAVSAAQGKKLAGEGLTLFQRIVALTGKAVLAEWTEALDRFFRDAENWARERDWGVKRDMKRLEDGILGAYDVPRLLIHTLENHRFFLDPIGREIVAATGRVDLCMIPSYDSVGIVRTEKGWFVLPDHGPERKRPLTREVFYKTLDRLAQAA